MNEVAEPRKRATSRDAAQRRSAMVVVRALHPAIAQVQRRAAFLLSMSELGIRDDRDPALMEAETAALQSVVFAYTESLTEQLGDLPPEIRTHGRIVDTLKALTSLYGVLGRARLNFARSAASLSQSQSGSAANQQARPRSRMSGAAGSSHIEVASS